MGVRFKVVEIYHWFCLQKGLGCRHQPGVSQVVGFGGGILTLESSSYESTQRKMPEDLDDTWESCKKGIPLKNDTPVSTKHSWLEKKSQHFDGIYHEKWTFSLASC